MKGLCPFHDEKSASFHVTPSRGFYHCFGCQAGGDVIKFVMEMDGLGFTETVERLAEKAGVQLRYEEGGAPRPRTGPHRPRLVEAHKHAGEWYAEQLATPEALTARQFLDSRGFDADAAATFGVGFSPRGGEDLLKHLRQKGFTDEELVTSGLIGEGRGLYDRFRGRLMWPIRDSSGDTIGFGARRIFDDDRIEAKYLNTPETPIYQQEPGALRHRPGPPRDRPRQPGGHRRGLHRRDGLPPRRRQDRGGHLRHLVRRRPRPGDPAAAARPRRVPRRGDLHLRRGRGRPEGGAPCVRGRPDLRRPDLCRGGAQRARPVRPAAAAGRCRGARAGGPPGAALPVRARQRGAALRPRPRRRPGRRDAGGGEAGDRDPRPVQGRRVLPRARGHARHRAGRRAARGAQGRGQGCRAACARARPAGPRPRVPPSFPIHASRG